VSDDAFFLAVPSWISWGQGGQRRRQMEEEKSGESPNAGSVHAPSQMQCHCIYMALASR
jgi:hypothetical protein